ncbi:hypothetical protein ACFQYP_60165 [Nonomuraea antimicrobica]
MSQFSGAAPPAVPGASGQPAPAISFQAGAAEGEAPLPWDIAAAAKPVRPAGWTSPIDGPLGLPMAAGGIGLLMAALWAVVTVQRGRNRRKVL